MEFWTSVRVIARRWYVLLGSLIFFALLGTALVRDAKPTYDATGSVVILQAAQPTDPKLGPVNPFQTADYQANQFAQIMGSALTDEFTKDELERAGVGRDYTIANSTNQTPVLYLTVHARSQQEALDSYAMLVDRLRDELYTRQVALKAPSQTLYTAVDLSVPGVPEPKVGSKIQAGLFIGIIGLIVSISLALAADSIFAALGVRTGGAGYRFAETDDDGDGDGDDVFQPAVGADAPDRGDDVFQPAVVAHAADETHETDVAAGGGGGGDQAEDREPGADRTAGDPARVPPGVLAFAPPPPIVIPVEIAAAAAAAAAADEARAAADEGLTADEVSAPGIGADSTPRAETPGATTIGAGPGYGSTDDGGDPSGVITGEMDLLAIGAPLPVGSGIVEPPGTGPDPDRPDPDDDGLPLVPGSYGPQAPTPLQRYGIVAIGIVIVLLFIGALSMAIRSGQGDAGEDWLGTGRPVTTTVVNDGGTNQVGGQGGPTPSTTAPVNGAAAVGSPTSSVASTSTTLVGAGVTTTVASGSPSSARTVPGQKTVPVPNPVTAPGSSGTPDPEPVSTVVADPILTFTLQPRAVTAGWGLSNGPVLSWLVTAVPGATISVTGPGGRLVGSGNEGSLNLCPVPVADGRCTPPPGAYGYAIVVTVNGASFQDHTELQVNPGAGT